jgi:cyclic pyranopterin phosphate synthase
MGSTGKKLTHLDADGRTRMVDVGDKEVTQRRARASGEIRMRPETLQAVADDQIAKGNVLEAARLAGIMAAKRTGELIPLCHPLALDFVDLTFVLGADRIAVEAEARVDARTGVEMEAMTAATVALLTIYDMCKAMDRGMVIGEVSLVEKTGGRSGHYKRQE